MTKKKDDPKYKSWESDEKAEVPPEPYTSKIVQLFDKTESKVHFKNLAKIKEGEEVVLSPETMEMVRGNAETCLLCRYIVEDFETNAKLTGHPKEVDGKGQFPIESKMRHVQIEKLYVKKVGDGAKPRPPEEPKGETDGE